MEEYSFKENIEVTIIFKNLYKRFKLELKNTYFEDYPTIVIDEENILQEMWMLSWEVHKHLIEAFSFCLLDSLWPSLYLKYLRNFD